MTRTCAKHLVSQSVDDVVAIILKGLDSVITLGGDVGTWLGKGDAPDQEHGREIRADGSALRQLQSWLKEKDPGFGGLIKLQNKRREFLWVHPQFDKEYCAGRIRSTVVRPHPNASTILELSFVHERSTQKQRPTWHH